MRSRDELRQALAAFRKIREPVVLQLGGRGEMPVAEVVVIAACNLLAWALNEGWLDNGRDQAFGDQFDARDGKKLVQAALRGDLKFFLGESDAKSPQ